MSMGDMNNLYNVSGCTAFNGQTCNSCNRLTNSCVPNCNKNTFGPSCTTCHSNCIACFGPRSHQCFACDTTQTTVNTYQTARNLCNSCGDGYRDTGNSEACDDGNNFPGDGCSPTCTIETNFNCPDGNPEDPDICTIPFSDAYRLQWGNSNSNPSSNGV